MSGVAQVAMCVASRIWQVVFASQTLQVFCLAFCKKAQYVVVILVNLLELCMHLKFLQFKAQQGGNELYLVYQKLSFHCQIHPPFHMLRWCCVILFIVKLLQGIDKGCQKVLCSCNVDNNICCGQQLTKKLEITLEASELEPITHNSHKTWNST